MAVERLNLKEEGMADILSNEHWLRYEAVAPLVKGKIVLDIACGSGYGTDYLAKNGAKEIIGCDIDKNSITKSQFCYQAPNLKFQTADALKLPFENGKFDLIVSLETIEHFSADKQSVLLQEFKRVLKEDGTLIVSTPNSLASREKNPWHLKELNKEELKNLLKEKFLYSRIYEQGSAMATFIKGAQESHFRISSVFQAKYYLALASDRELTNELPSLASLNPLALAAKENHPLMKIIDKIYCRLNKLSFFTQIFKSFSERTLKREAGKRE